MVSQADAGADPRTVMIHPNHTSPTLATVVRSGRFYSIAARAKLKKSLPDRSQLVIVEHDFVFGHIRLASAGKTHIITGKHHGSTLRLVTIPLCQ